MRIASFFFLSFVQVKHPVHQLPLFCRRSTFFRFLEDSHIGLPFFLARQSSHLSHCRIPFKIQWSLNNHEQSASQNINLHFQNTYRPYCFQSFSPDFSLRVSFLIFSNQLWVFLLYPCFLSSIKLLLLPNREHLHPIRLHQRPLIQKPTT